MGQASWRARNEVFTRDALDLLNSSELAGVSVIYVDPPYTRDQYSRFYHVYETLYRYDYPDARGQGRTRSDGFTTGFSRKSGVEAAFRALFKGASRLAVPLVVSYPANGLLTEVGVSVDGLARDYFRDVAHSTFTASHSTLGASSGSSRKPASEQLFVLVP